jgi:DNA polymerase III gamma/tau subunit
LQRGSSLPLENKVYIIDDADLMAEASNCLLKTLEEPPRHVIISCSHPRKARFAHGRSRCQRFELADTAEIENRLNNLMD